MSGIKGAVAEAVKVAGEAVVRPVADELVRDLEVAGQSMSGQMPSSQQIQQNQKADALKVADAQRRIQWWKDLAARQQLATNQAEQATQQKQAEEKQGTEIKQFEVVKKRQNRQEAMEVQSSRGEVRAGKGVRG